MIRFFERCNPPKRTAQQSSRFGQGRFYKDEKGEAATATWQAVLMPHRPKTPLEGPICVRVIVVYPYTKGDTKTKAQREALAINPYLLHTSKPDLDNLSKMLLDSMTSLSYWGDDSQVVSLTLMKLRGAFSGVYIEAFKAGEFDLDCAGDTLSIAEGS